MAPKLLKTAALIALCATVGVGEARGDARAQMVRALKRPCTTYPATTNYAQRSEALDDTAVWAETNAAVATTADSASCPLFNGTRMDLVSNAAATNADAIFQATTTPATAGPFAVSVHVATTSGTATKTFAGTCISGSVNAATCSCTVQGGTCSATIDAHRCVVTVTATTDVARAAALYTCAAPVTTPGVVVWGGQRGTSTGAVCAAGAQLEIGATASPYIATPALANVTRAAGCYR